MKTAFSKIVVITIGIFYLFAFFEVDVKDYKQTYGDEYDTYIHAEKQDVSSSQKIAKYLDFTFELPHSFLLADDFIAKDFTDLFSPSPPFSPPKIYLRNSVFRI